MGTKKLNPLQVVAKTMADGGTMSEAEYIRSFMGVFDALEKRAKVALENDDSGIEALDAAREFCAVTEIVNVFGRYLITTADEEDMVVEYEPELDPEDAN